MVVSVTASTTQGSVHHIFCILLCHHPGVVLDSGWGDSNSVTDSGWGWDSNSVTDSGRGWDSNSVTLSTLHPYSQPPLSPSHVSSLAHSCALRPARFPHSLIPVASHAASYTCNCTFYPACLPLHPRTTALSVTLHVLLNNSPPPPLSISLY